MENLDTLCYIQEQTSFVEDYNSFGYTPYKEDGRLYLIFDAVLHSFGVRNRNQREYNKENVWERIQNDEMIQEWLRHNSWMGEVDHPAPQYEDQKLTVQRISTPDMTRDSHFIRRPRLNGNLLEATIQTDSGTEAGRNMAIKIVDGKMVPCFSARVMGSLQNIGGKPTVYVKKLVTYDWVLFPSHKEAVAKLNQPILESAEAINKAFNESKIIYLPELARMAANSSKETEWLCESFGLDINSVVGLTKTGNSVVITENANVYVQPITDGRIRNKTRSLLNDWLSK